VNAAVLVLAIAILVVLVPLGAIAASRGYRRVDGSSLPEPYQRRTFRIMVVFVGILVASTLWLGLAPHVGAWILAAWLILLLGLMVWLSLRGYRSYKRLRARH
jgi:hypothetical protein